jgi:hypothetical protein
MKVHELIDELEKLDPDAVVLIPNRDHIESYRSPSWLVTNIWVQPSRDIHKWFEATNEERDRDIPGVIL